MHAAQCVASEDDECASLKPELDDASVTKLDVRWAACVDGVTQLSSSAVSDADSTYDLTWPSDEPPTTPLFRREVLECAEFNVTLPSTPASVDPVVPELFVAQHRLPAPHAIDADADRALCQHSSFGHLVLMPPPIVDDLSPPALCRQDASAVLTLRGRLIVQAKPTAASGDDTMTSSSSGSVSKAMHTVTRTTSSASVAPSAANNFSLASVDFTLADDKLALSNCTVVAVDRYASVEICSVVALTLDGKQHFASPDIPLGSLERDPAKIAPLS